MLIDAHQHVWRLDASWHEWPAADLPEIHRDFDLDDLRAVRAAAGVQGSILIQSQPAEEDTLWLLSLAEREASVLGVVGWTDLKAADAETRIRSLASHPKLVGLRPMLQSLPEGWMLDPALVPAVGAMLKSGLCFDALVKPHQLGELRDFAARWPALPIIIDHCGKPALSGEGFEAWRDGMAALADIPHVQCKLSGLLTEGEPEEADGVDRIVETVFRLFGASRIVWGSDWPVLTLRTDYADWLERSRRGVRRLAPEAEAEVFGLNALRFYGLNLPASGVS